MSLASSDLNRFLSAHPDIELCEIVLPDLSGGLRGKWLTADKLPALFAGELKLPSSSVAFDVWGRDLEGWALANGDGDGICQPELRSLAPIPWSLRPMAQLMVSLACADGSPHPLDPRQILRRLQGQLQRRGLQPVIASEMEFFLLQPERDAQGRPQHTQTDTVGGALARGQTYGLEAMGDAEEFLHDVRESGLSQGLPLDTLIKEGAPSQYEINLLHRADALEAADQALLLRRLIRCVARRHGLLATFMAKPFGDLAGNGMHLHCSLLDTDGKNVFDDGTGEGGRLLRQAIAGCLETLPDVMLLLAPHQNSYRRFRPGAHVPLAQSWGYENRTVALRVPVSAPSARRYEHRVAGADAQPHLATAAVLAGMLYGIENELEPPAAIAGNAYDQLQSNLPRTWEAALEQFQQSQFIADYFGSELQSVFASLKQQEIDEFARHVTPLEYDTSL